MSLTLVQRLLAPPATHVADDVDEGVALHGASVEEGREAALGQEGPAYQARVGPGAVVVAGAVQRVGSHGLRVLSAKLHRGLGQPVQNCGTSNRGT